jgi:hypothetical protein
VPLRRHPVGERPEVDYRLLGHPVERGAHGFVQGHRLAVGVRLLFQ